MTDASGQQSGDDPKLLAETSPVESVWPETARRASLVAGIGLRRAVRRALARPKRTAFLLLLFGGVWLNVLFGGGPPAPSPGAGSGTVPSTTAGTALSGTAVDGFGELARGLAAIGWVVAVGLATVGATPRLSDVDGGSLVVPAAGVRATFLGTLVAEHARRFALIGLFVLLTLGSVAFGGGGVESLPTGGIAVLCIFVTAELVGHVLALGWTLSTGGDVLGPGVRLLGGGAILLGCTLAVVRLETVIALFAATPLAWYGELFLLGTPVAANGTYAAVALVGSVLAVPPLYLLAERLARRVWFLDSSSEPSSGASGSTLADVLLAPVTSQQSRAVARRVWLQTIRRPKTLVFVGIPFLFAGTVVASGDYPPSFPVLLGLYGAWAAGIGTSLNPLSTEGSGLPLLLSSPAAGASVVRGYVVASVTVAVPAVTVVVLVSSPLAGFGPTLTLAGVVAGVGVVLGTAPVSVAIGVGIPRIEQLDVAGDEGPLAPSKFALAAHSVVVVLLSLPALAGVALAARFGVPALLLGVGSSVAVASLAGAIGYRYAASRFGTLTLDG
jgi:ABC-2 type transport system permease protein